MERTKIKATVKKDKVTKLSGKSKNAILDSIERGYYKEVQLHAEGKIKLNTLKEFLDEL